MPLKRCHWCTEDIIYQRYHDEEWGRPSFDSQHLFEMLILESFQAGLSWLTILRRREHFRKAFEGFSPKSMAAFTGEHVDQLLKNTDIIRHRKKIEAAINNANAYLRLEEKLPFSDFIWNFVDGKPRVNHPETSHDIPAKTDISIALSQALKAEGFSFVGPVICYAFMQACGLVNDHHAGCFLFSRS